MATQHQKSYVVEFLRLGSTDLGLLLLGVRGAPQAVLAWLGLIALLLACVFFNWLAIPIVLFFVSIALLFTGCHTLWSMLSMWFFVLTGFFGSAFFWWGFYTNKNYDDTPPAANWYWAGLPTLALSLLCMVGIAWWGYARKQ